jgi:hypothetical protein
MDNAKIVIKQLTVRGRSADVCHFMGTAAASTHLSGIPSLTPWGYRYLGAVFLIILATLTGCGKGKGHDTVKGAHQLKASEMSVAERKYGIAPVADPSVTYQPAVVLVGGGAEAIREQSTNGFIWTIDGSVPRANELAPGKIFFMTGRAVGRVLDVHKSGGDLVVTVGPANLTEIVREAHIHIEAMPVDFGEALEFNSPDMPGEFVPLTRTITVPAPSLARDGQESGWRFYRTQAPGTPPAASAPSPTRNYNEKNFKTKPHATLSTLGIEVSVNDNGFKLAAQADLHFSAPSLKVDFDIVHGKVESAALELRGAAGLNWDFNTGSKQTMTASVAALLQPNVDFSIPIAAVGGLPLAITLRQRFLLRTGLAIKDSTLSATGSYTFNGAFKVGYVKGDWSADAPDDYTAEQSMTKTGEGVSLGIEGLNLSDTVRIFVGLGAGGFAAGPYLSFNSAIGVFRNSSIGMLRCNGSTLIVSLRGGVGYVIPKSITDLINSVLAALNIKYEITGEGGLEPGQPRTVINKSSQMGGCNVDQNPDEKGTVKGGP